MLLVADSGHSATNGYRNAGYGSALHSLDHGLHNITQALKATGMWTNTLLMLTADNGGDNPVGLASNYPLLGETGLLPPLLPPSRATVLFSSALPTAQTTILTSVARAIILSRPQVSQLGRRDPDLCPCVRRPDPERQARYSEQPADARR